MRDLGPRAGDGGGRAKPLVSYQVIIDLIGTTTTKTGFTVQCELDRNAYPKGICVSDQEMAALTIARANFHGDWNYTISPLGPPNPSPDS
jgi:hypothetical protein